MYVGSFCSPLTSLPVDAEVELLLVAVLWLLFVLFAWLRVVTPDRPPPAEVVVEAPPTVAEDAFPVAPS